MAFDSGEAADIETVGSLLQEYAQEKAKMIIRSRLSSFAAFLKI